METWLLLKYITTCLCPFPWISYAHFSRGIKLEAKSAHRSALPMKVDLYSNVYHEFIRKTSDRVVRKLARFLRRCTIPRYLSIYGDLRNMMYSSLDARLIHLYIISRNKYASFFASSARITSLSHFQLENKQFSTRIRLSFLGERRLE